MKIPKRSEPLSRLLKRRIMCYKDLCRSALSADMSTDSRPICRPTYRPILGRHIGRLLVDISAESADRYSVDRGLYYTCSKKTACKHGNVQLCIGKTKPTSEKGLLHACYCSLLFFSGFLALAFSQGAYVQK